MHRQLGLIALIVCFSPLSQAEIAIDQCKPCVQQVDKIADYLKQKLADSEKSIIADVTLLCEALRIQDPTVCSGAIEEFAPEVLAVLIDRLVDGQGICAYLGHCPKSVTAAQDLARWRQQVWQGQTELPKTSRTSKTNSGNVASFVQVSDVHLDPIYQAGAPTKCGEPICCRAKSPRTPASQNARIFGEYDCDAPQILVESAFVRVGDLAPGFVLLTGDSSPHNIWNQSVDEQIASMTNVADLLDRALGPDVAVYPSIGNHDVFPVDEFKEDPKSRLLEAIAEIWSRWLPEEALATVRRGGYYSHLHSQSLRIVALNTQVCDDFNFWLLDKRYGGDHFDPYGQLAWLLDVLKNAEVQGEKVYISGHIPPGSSSCFSHYNLKYLELARRFSHVIGGHLYGHTHDDEFRLLFASNNSTDVASGVINVTPSITPLVSTNPSFRRYWYDVSDGSLIDYEQWYADLESANRNNTLSWQATYQARQEYQMPDLSPMSWLRLAQQMSNRTGEWLQKYVRHYFTQMDPQPACDKGCQNELLCDVNTITLSGNRACTGTTPDFNDVLNMVYEQ